MKSFMLFILGIMCCLILFQFICYADESKDVQQIRSILAEHKAVVESWESKATILIALSVIVGVLGIVAASIQKIYKSWAKATTVSVGLIISLITLMNNTVFEADYQTFKAKGFEAKQLIADVEIMLNLEINRDNPQDREAWLKPIRDKLGQIYEVEKNLYSASLDLELVPKAYAQSFQRYGGMPKWLKEFPKDESNLYFIGHGDSRLLQRAKDYAYNNAVQLAVDYLTLQFQTQQTDNAKAIDAEKLSKYLIKSSKVADTYFLFNKNDTLYQYHLLLSLDRKILETDVTLFAIQERISLPTDFTKSIDIKQTYYDRRIALYSDVLEAARGSLSQPDYETFLKAHEYRKEGQNQKAVDALMRITQRNPQFYFGWYNLALAYDNLNNYVLADQAYKKAVELEKKDASLFNSYGYFLYRYQKYDEAIQYLRKALEIDPDHPNAKITLKAAMYYFKN